MMKNINEVFPNGWPEIVQRTKAMRERLFGVVPDIPAVELADLDVPDDVLKTIRQKNRRRVRDEIPLDEFVGEASPFRTDEYFDDQLLEVIFSIASRYEPQELIGQYVWMIQKFLNESAALRSGSLAGRITRRNANSCIDVIKKGLDESTDPDEKQTLELLLTDLTNGGEENWVSFLEPELRGLVQQTVAKQLE